MKCPKCENVEMVVGKAICTGQSIVYERAIIALPSPPIDSTNIELIDVLKCPKCGHSEYIDNVIIPLTPSTKHPQGRGI